MSNCDRYLELSIKYHRIRLKYAKKLREALEQDLKESGLFETDVLDSDTNLTGRLKIVLANDSRFDNELELRFFPYLDNDELSKRSKPVDPYRDLNDRFKIIWKG